jgi:hypothetical protein
MMQLLMSLALAAILLAGFCPPETKEDPQTSRESLSDSSAEKSAPPKIEDSLKRPGYDSPEAVFAAYKQAYANKDFPALVRCFAPEIQDWMLGMWTVVALLSTDQLPEEPVHELVELMAKHGFNEEGEPGELPFKTREDRDAYLTELFNWMNKIDAKYIDDSESLLDQFWGQSTGNLGEIKTDGDKASATVMDGDNQPEKLEFIQIEGKWFLTMPGFED